MPAPAEVPGADQAQLGRWPLDVPFDQYQRYRIVGEVADALRTSGSAPLVDRVLDVGGQHLDMDGQPRCPAQAFLPRWRTTVIDIPPHRLPGYVRASAEALPFADRSFDLVSCVDVLEHLPPWRRPHLLGELRRVAARLVVVAAPFGDPSVSRAEDVFATFIRRAWGSEQAQLAEHRQHGLPDLRETWDRFARDGWATHVFPYGNLWRWLFMMIDKHAVGALAGSQFVHRALDERYNRELFEGDTELPCYRHFVVASRNANDPVVGWVRDRFPPPAARRPPAEAEAFFELATLHAANQEIQVRSEPARRKAHVEEVERHRAEMYRHLAAKDAYIAKLEDLLQEVEASYTYRARELLRGFLPKRGNRESS